MKNRLKITPTIMPLLIFTMFVLAFQNCAPKFQTAAPPESNSLDSISMTQSVGSRAPLPEHPLTNIDIYVQPTTKITKYVGDRLAERASGNYTSLSKLFWQRQSDGVIVAEGADLIIEDLKLSDSTIYTLVGQTSDQYGSLLSINLNIEPKPEQMPAPVLDLSQATSDAMVLEDTSTSQKILFKYNAGPQFHYQWFKNGIALPNEIFNNITIIWNKSEGLTEYKVELIMDGITITNVWNVQ